MSMSRTFARAAHLDQRPGANSSNTFASQAASRRVRKRVPSHNTAPLSDGCGRCRAHAESAALRRIRRLSAFGAPESRIISELQKAEEDLKASGLPWTILQPTFFMQNMMMAASTVREQGTVYWERVGRG
jgi:hypothetical protein